MKPLLSRDLLVLIFCTLVFPQPASAIEMDSVITRNLSVSEALALLDKAGLKVEELSDATALPNADTKQYVVFPSFPTNDVLVLIAGPKRGDDMVVDEILWYLNWSEESLLPKSQRKYRRLKLVDIDLSMLGSSENKSNKKLKNPKAE